MAAHCLRKNYKVELQIIFSLCCNIAGIKDGFFVTGLRGIGTDIPTGNFSVGASGFWIKNGEIAFPVDGVTLGGNTLEILKNVELAADDLEMRGGLNSPSFKISELAVGGK